MALFPETCAGDELVLALSDALSANFTSKPPHQVHLRLVVIGSLGPKSNQAHVFDAAGTRVLTQPKLQAWSLNQNQHL